MSTKKKIRVLVNGAKGKMGSESVKAVRASETCTLIAIADKGDSLSRLMKETGPDVVLDFTHPDCIYDNVTCILEHNAHAVIGTTGLSDTELKTIDSIAKAKKRGALIVPNFAIGAVLMMKFAAQAAQYMPHAEIIEYHHNNKADAPSGTAIKTAEMMGNQNPKINKTPLQEIELIKGSRGGKKNNIPIHSIRLPGYIAHQEVVMGGLGQTLSIRHDTINRESFMPGVILSIEKVRSLLGLVYGLEKIL